MNVSVEGTKKVHFFLGKEEVTSSNLVIGSLYRGV